MEDTHIGTDKYSRIFAITETILIVAGLLGFLLLLHHGVTGDGYDRFKDLQALLHFHVRNPASRYSLIGPIFSLPIWLLARMFANPEERIQFFNPLLFAFSLFFTYILLRNRIDRGLLRKFFLILIAASMYPANLATFYGETFTSLCVGLGLLAVIVRFSSSARVMGWLVIVLGVANTPATLAGLGLVVLKQIWDSKRLRYVLVLVAAAGLVGLEAWVRRGSPLKTGYAGDEGVHTVMPYSGLPGFSYPFLFGLLSILFSFGRGLVFFAPGLLLPVRSTLLRMQLEKKIEVYRLYVLWLCFLVGMILIYSRWWAWYGGQFWGPRFFLFASIPASFALAVRLQHKNTSLLVNVFTLVVLSLSSWIGANSALFINHVFGQGDQAYDVASIPQCVLPRWDLEALCHYTPEYSVLWYPFVVHPHLDALQISYLAFFLLVFTYLMIPLLIKIVAQLMALLNKYGRGYLDLKVWHF